jgi:hypothetical protein
VRRDKGHLLSCLNDKKAPGAAPPCAVAVQRHSRTRFTAWGRSRSRGCIVARYLLVQATLLVVTLVVTGPNILRSRSTSADGQGIGDPGFVPAATTGDA